MQILIIGSGGREYSIALALKQDPQVSKIYFAPGNGATDDLGENIAIKDYDKLADFAKENAIDLTIVGPEDPLSAGVVDIFKSRGLVIFGPSKQAAQLESSKVFMKNFLARHAIPTAAYIQSDDFSKANAFIDSLQTPIVIKADGLCAGKGVIIAQSCDEAKEAAREMLSGERFGEAGKHIVVEEFLDGYELSVFALCDGKDFIVLPAAQDHKKLLDHDAGPNTGGMGAYAPTPLIDTTLYEKIKNRVIIPTLQGMQEENNPFEGVLFIGLMIVNGEPIVLEYNVRFGDPECEILMPLIKSSVSELFYSAATQNLKNYTLQLFHKYAVCVVMASENYPYKSSKPSEILLNEPLDTQINANTHICFAGVSREDEKLFATGGRVLACVGLGDSIQEARNRAYERCGDVHFAGKQYRSDIAYQALQS
ncbi:MAG: phosphoribosylamine--glycine ligase [Sulfurospirillum sp.]|nr:phosphoribosylamine--glycine ligase [Sulfurospirillum sp.]